MTETLEECRRTSQKSCFRGAAKWLDAQSLDEKYKGRPEQVARIKTSARKMFCQNRGTWLWEDF
eukprot:8048146-Pyramimonas_sp.AAC.1